MCRRLLRADARICSVVAEVRQRKAAARQSPGAYPADMVQDRPAPAYLLALIALAADEDALDSLAMTVARDVAAGVEPSPEELAAARSALDWLFTSLRAGPVPGPGAVRILREGAAAAARAGAPLRPVLDRTLSAGWAVWAAATGREELSPAGLAALGEALLRTGDAAAAAIADAHAAAEREIATRSASALRELFDALLDLADGDGPARARLVRRAGELGIPVDRPIQVTVAVADRDLEDGDGVVADVGRRLEPGAAPALGDLRVLGGARPRPVVAAAHGRLLVLMAPMRHPPDIAAALQALGAGWTATTTEAATLLGTAAAAREATAALAVARRLGMRDEVLPAASLALERALLAEPALLAAAVERELAALDRAPRGSGLLDTLEAYLAARENIRAAARVLGVAPRTVAYRLERIERILGGPLDADRRLRLATAVFARRLLVVPDASSGGAAARSR